jgi:hypothetical protein
MGAFSFLRLSGMRKRSDFVDLCIGQEIGVQTPALARLIAKKNFF